MSRQAAAAVWRPCDAVAAPGRPPESSCRSCLVSPSHLRSLLLALASCARSCSSDSATVPPSLPSLGSSSRTKQATQPCIRGHHSLSLHFLHPVHTLSLGDASSALFLPCFLAHRVRLALPHLLHRLATPNPAGATSPAVSRAAVLPRAANLALRSLRAAIEGTPRCARARGTQRRRSRHRSHPPSLCH